MAKKLQRKPIPGYEGYEITSNGDVYSLDRWIEYPLECKNGQKMVSKFFRGKKLRHHKHPRGYIKIILCADGHHYNHTLHELVLMTFATYKPGKKIRFKNGNPKDCRLSNLYYTNIDHHRSGK